jgi:hypothetical protein
MRLCLLQHIVSAQLAATTGKYEFENSERKV